VLANGVVIAGDELRPGAPANADGGSIFKFVPSVVYTPASGPITDLAQSPWLQQRVRAAIELRE